MTKNLIILILAALVSYTYADVFNDALGYWEFENANGQIVYDSTANNNNLYMGNSIGNYNEDPIRVTDGYCGSGLWFPYGDAVVSSLNDLNDFDFMPNQPFSISLWIMKTELESNSYLVSKMEASGNYRGWTFVWRKGIPEEGSSNDLLEFLLRSENVPGKRLWVRSGECVNNTTDAGSLWVHLAMAYDGSCQSSGVKFYVNGYLVSDSVAVIDSGLDVSDNTTNNTPLCIGGRNNSGVFGEVWIRLLSGTGSLQTVRSGKYSRKHVLR